MNVKTALKKKRQLIEINYRKRNITGLYVILLRK